jgi:hypothetical protein
LLNIDWHYDNARLLYEEGKNKAFTADNNNNRYHQQKWLTPEQIQAYDEYYYNYYPELTKKYLYRWNQLYQEE